MQNQRSIDNTVTMLKILGTYQAELRLWENPNSLKKYFRL